VAGIVGHVARGRTEEITIRIESDHGVQAYRFRVDSDTWRNSSMDTRTDDEYEFRLVRAHRPFANTVVGRYLWSRIPAAARVAPCIKVFAIGGKTDKKVPPLSAISVTRDPFAGERIVDSHRSYSSLGVVDWIRGEATLTPSRTMYCVFVNVYPPDRSGICHIQCTTEDTRDFAAVIDEVEQIRDSLHRQQ